MSEKEENCLYVFTEKNGRQIIGRIVEALVPMFEEAGEEGTVESLDAIRLYEPMFLNDAWIQDKRASICSNVVLLSLSSVEIVAWVDLVGPQSWRPAGEPLQRFYTRELERQRREFGMAQAGIVAPTPGNEAAALAIATGNARAKA